MTYRPPVRLAAASLTALFVLTGCSSSEVFDFTEPSMGPAQSIELRIPDELVELSEDYTETRVFESVTVTAVEPDDPSECAVEYRFNYAEGGLERLLEYAEDTPGDEGGVEERMADILTGKSLDSIQLKEGYTPAVVHLKCALSPTDDESTMGVSFFRVEENEDKYNLSSFADADIAVMQGGELFVQGSEVMSAWELDSNGNWVK